MSDEDVCVVSLRGLCDPRNSLCCWWDEYPLDSSEHRIHAYSTSGVAMGAFCSESCALAWSIREKPVSSLYTGRLELDCGLSNAVSAPPKEVLKRFGGTVNKKDFRSASMTKKMLGTAVRCVSEMELGARNSPLMKSRFYIAESKSPFAINKPENSKVCWWDGHDLPATILSDPYRLAIFYAPAKRLFVKDRYRFSESVESTCPMRTRPETFVEYAAFCSPKCRKSWTLYTFDRTPRLVALSMTLEESRAVLKGEESPGLAPDRLALKKYGGFLSISEFRDECLGASTTSTRSTPRIESTTGGSEFLVYDVVVN